MLSDFELIRFLLWCEQIERPRPLRLCEFVPNADRTVFLGEDYNPIFQTIGWDGNIIGDDEAGQAGIKALVEAYNDWCSRLKENRAKPLLTAIDEGKLAYSEDHFDELASDRA